MKFALIIVALCASCLAQDKKAFDSRFVLMESGVAASTAFDLWSTRGALNRGCRETNIFTGEHPSNAKAISIIGGIEAGLTVADFFIKRGTRSKWWVVSPSIRMAIHTGAAISNMHCGR